MFNSLFYDNYDVLTLSTTASNTLIHHPVEDKATVCTVTYITVFVCTYLWQLNFLDHIVLLTAFTPD